MLHWPTDIVSEHLFVRSILTRLDINFTRHLHGWFNSHDLQIENTLQVSELNLLTKSFGFNNMYLIGHFPKDSSQGNIKYFSQQIPIGWYSFASRPITIDKYQLDDIVLPAGQYLSINTNKYQLDDIVLPMPMPSPEFGCSQYLPLLFGILSHLIFTSQRRRKSVITRQALLSIYPVSLQNTLSPLYLQ